MDQSTQGGLDYPIDNPTYNLMQALVSKLEALETYRKYQKDGDQELFQQLIDDDRQHAEQILQMLRQRLGGG